MCAKRCIGLTKASTCLSESILRIELHLAAAEQSLSQFLSLIADDSQIVAGIDPFTVWFRCAFGFQLCDRLAGGNMPI